MTVIILLDSLSKSWCSCISFSNGCGLYSLLPVLSLPNVKNACGAEKVQAQRLHFILMSLF